MDILNKPISISQISNLERYQLKEVGVAKYLDLSDADRTYEVLKTLSERQYRFLGWLFIEKHYKKIAKILLDAGLKPNPDYIDYLNKL
jgi:hypothetical protein